MDATAVITLVVTSAITSIVSLVVTTVWQFVGNNRKKRQKEFDKIHESIKQLDERLEANDKLTKEGIQALLRHNLYEVYARWSPKGYCPDDVKSNFDNMFAKYHSLGANGMMNKIYEYVMALPSTAPTKNIDNKR